MAACLIQRLCRRGVRRKSADASAHEDDVPSPASQQRRPFSIGDVVLGAAIKKSSQQEPPHLSAAATVPHMNLAPLHEPEAPRRSSTVSSIPLKGPDGVSQSTAEKAGPTPRSEVYDDDDEWKAPPPLSARATPRSNRGSNSKPSTPPRWSSRSSNDEDDTRRHRAAICIQASIKSYAVRRRLALDNAGALSRRYIERKHFNVALANAVGCCRLWSSLWFEKLTRLRSLFVAGIRARVLGGAERDQGPSARTRSTESPAD